MPLGAGGGLKDLEKIKNVALVMVTARVPATGARRGDKLDCHVSGINGKSLAGGRLAFAALQGPNTLRQARVRRVRRRHSPGRPDAAAGGRHHRRLPDGRGRVSRRSSSDGRITLVLDEHHANFQTATEVAESIHAQYSREGDGFVQAINASNIVVQIPERVPRTTRWRSSPTCSTSTIYSPEPEARVVINQRTGSIVISGDVTIGDVVVSHKNVVIEAGQPPTFTADRPRSDRTTRSCSRWSTALNSIKVPHEDVVEIIKGIARNGKLHGRLIIE